MTLDVISPYFHEITKEAGSGPDATALGNPNATLSVIFTSADGAKKVTLSVDQYATAADASAAYQQAVEGSQAAPGFNLLPPPDLGEMAYAGTSAVGDEKHAGLGVLDGRLIIAATIAGFDTGPDDIAKLNSLAQREVATSLGALGTG